MNEKRGNNVSTTTTNKEEVKQLVSASGNTGLFRAATAASEFALHHILFGQHPCHEQKLAAVVCGVGWKFVATATTHWAAVPFLPVHLR
jgi:hypothetical protein